MAVGIVVCVLVMCAMVIRGPVEQAIAGSPARDDVITWIDKVRTVPVRETVPGYGRQCPGACVFGRAWSDSTSAPAGHNGCSTREDVLARDIVGAQPVTGNRCARRGGALLDPYSGRVLQLGDSYRDIHIDHVFPLAAAWDLGAAQWTQSQRERFANDVDLNLLAVSATANTTKSDDLPAAWLPVRAWQCFYVWRVAIVAWAYGLAVTEADAQAMRKAARSCPS